MQFFVLFCFINEEGYPASCLKKNILRNKCCTRDNSWEKIVMRRDNILNEVEREEETKCTKYGTRLKN